MVEIEYEVRERDLVAFNEHQIEKSGKLQKIMRRHQSIVPGVIALIALVLWLYLQNTLAAIYTGSVALAWGLLTPAYLRWSIRRQIRQMYTPEQKTQVLGHQVLRTTPAALVEITAGAENAVPWKDVLRLETTKQYAFLFVGLENALIIPRATVKRGNLQDFFKAVDAAID